MNNQRRKALLTGLGTIAGTTLGAPGIGAMFGSKASDFFNTTPKETSLKTTGSSSLGDGSKPDYSKIDTSAPLIGEQKGLFDNSFIPGANRMIDIPTIKAPMSRPDIAVEGIDDEIVSDNIQSLPNDLGETEIQGGSELFEPVGLFGDTAEGQQALNADPSVGVASEVAENGFNASSLLPYAGGLMNIYQGLFGDTDVPDTPQVDYSPALDMETDIDVTDQIDQNMTSARQILADPNATSAQKRAALSQKMKMDNQVYSGKRRGEQELRNRQRSEISRINSQNVGLEAQYDQYEMQTDANKTNMLTQGLADLATSYQKGQQLEQMKDMDTASIKAYRDTLQTEAEKEAFDAKLKEWGITI